MHWSFETYHVLHQERLDEMRREVEAAALVRAAAQARRRTGAGDAAGTRGGWLRRVLRRGWPAAGSAARRRVPADEPEGVCAY